MSAASDPRDPDPARMLTKVRRWYDDHQRDLPWRRPDASPWAIMVSEFMLQQTPVSRVLPVYEAWMRRWPDPRALAEARAADVIRMWGKLGYPRRALRLHAAAQAICEHHSGRVPSSIQDLRALPGVGSYTAAAVAAFAFEQRVAVIDTNVRRVISRAVNGTADSPTTTVADTQQLEALLPAVPQRAAKTSIGLMELGALICTARSPRCDNCPIRSSCLWLAEGCPEYDGPQRKPQAFAGTDRQVRGLLMDVLREASEPVSKSRLDMVWADPVQRERALQSLLVDRLALLRADGHYELPH